METTPQTEAESKRTEAKAVAKQLEIDWTRARQLMVLASSEVTDATIVEGTTPRKVRGIVLKSVLQAIDHHGRGRAAWISYETIAREARVSLRQAKRAIQALEQESLIVVDTRKVNHYSIVWSELNLRCPSHRQLASESAAPVPLPAPVQDDSASERSALRPQRSALATERSALRPQRSALEGTQTDPKPNQNRNEPPPPTPSQPVGGGGWEMICEEWKARICKISQIAAEAKKAGESPEEFLGRLRFAWEVVIHPANKKTFRKPAGAVVHWFRYGTWPVDGVVDPTDVEAARKESQLELQRVHEKERRAVELDVFQTVKAGRRAGKRDEDIRADLLKRWSSDLLAKCGW